MTNAHSAGDEMFLIAQTAWGGPVAPDSSWSANTVSSTSIYPLAAWLWIVQAVTADTAQSVTVSVALDKSTTFQ
jgi:hypothetical protein